jgi:hypothetical protein
MAMAEIDREAPQAHEPGGPSRVSKTECVALVPVDAAPRRLAAISVGLTRPDPSFVMHLIAMAERSPQTRPLRRAAPQDVQVAYGLIAHPNQTAAGSRMRQLA